MRTVEGVVSALLERTLGEPVRLAVAGRTDAGVHARGQVASFTTGSRRRPDQIRAFLNGELGPEVAVERAAVVPASFHARFNATAREYRYVINTGEAPDPFVGRFEWYRPGALHAPSMRRAAASLLGEHDFTSFCRHPGAGKSTTRDLQRAAVSRDGDRVVLVFRANAFLHQMVRSLVGTLVRVGQGKLETGAVAAMLAARTRAGSAQLAPARGLTLERVVYGRRS